jgi:ribosome-associated translation inhibitor RaiA
MYAAIDALSDKLTRRVRKRKERVNEHRAPLARRHQLAAAL